MNEGAPLTPIQSAPLDMLVRFNRRQKVVDISVDILCRLNVGLLDRIIRFKLDHSFKCVIEGEVVHNSHRDEPTRTFQSTISICPEPSDWPEPCERYAKLYCASICTAASLAAMKEDPEGGCLPQITKKQWGISPMSPFLDTVRFGYGFAVPRNGKELLKIIKRRLDMIRDELPGVAETLTNGPIPGSTEQDDV